MPRPRVFISSTCYDLGVVRAQLHSFIEGLGFEAVLSERGDVLYDLRHHTHTSCVSEVANCDMLVLLVGGRFGGTAVEKAKRVVDATHLDELTNVWLNDADTASKTGREVVVSITQLEVIRAIQLAIPVFTLVKRDVWHDHLVYQTNGGMACLGAEHFGDGAETRSISFPSIEKQSTAGYVFEFLNYLRRRAANNGIEQFDTTKDIESYLQKQWASQFQRFLVEQRTGMLEQQAVLDISEQIDGLRAAVLSAINEDKKQVASAVIKHRTVLEIAYTLTKDSIVDLADAGKGWSDVLAAATIEESKTICATRNRRGLIDRLVLIRSDRTFWRSKYGAPRWLEFQTRWSSFLELERATRKSAAETVVEDQPEARMLTKDDRPIEDAFSDEELETVEAT